VKRISPISPEGGDRVKVLHMTRESPWGQRRLEHKTMKEIGGHYVCTFKVTNGDTVDYYSMNISEEVADELKLNRNRQALIDFITDHENLRHATHLDKVKVAT
jgi:hypothetical protein